jgi:hypothetical protein
MLGWVEGRRVRGLLFPQHSRAAFGPGWHCVAFELGSVASYYFVLLLTPLLLLLSYFKFSSYFVLIFLLS